MDATVLWPTPRNFLRSLRFGFDVLLWSQQQTLRLFVPFLAGLAPRPQGPVEAIEVESTGPAVVGPSYDEAPTAVEERAAEAVAAETVVAEELAVDASEAEVVARVEAVTEPVDADPAPGTVGGGEVEAVTEADDLTVIGGIGPKLAERLADFGVTTFAQLAAWSADDVARFEATLPVVQRGRLEREGWIGQAAALVAVAA